MPFDPRLPVFYAAEIETYAPAVSGTSSTPAHATHAHAVPSDPTAPEVVGLIRASDSGYRTRPTDTPAVAVFPARMAEAFAIDRRINLDPGGAGLSASWGRVSLSNARGIYDNIAGTQNSDGRPVRIYAGQRTLDASRGLFLDPPFASLTPLFQGVAQPWALSESTLDIPFRDATYWAERPLQSTVYAGTGGYDGGADILGLPKPKTRGGTASYPVRDVRPVLIDAANRIYQYTDAAGSVVALYEGGDTNIPFSANTTNLYAGSTPAGQYRTDNSRGLFQLGSSPVRTITVDVTGEFPTAGAVSSLASIARYLLAEDMQMPAGNIATAAFSALAAAFPYPAGAYFGATPIAGTDALAYLLAGAGFKLVPLRSGALSIMALRDVSAAVPVAAIGPAEAASCTPLPLPASVSPPAYRIRVGYQRNYAPALVDVSPAVTSMTRKSFLANEYRYAGWAGGAVLLAYRRPNDPDPIGGALLVPADAQAAADGIGALWGVRRRLYAVSCPATTALAREIGDVIRLTWPADDLRGGQNGVIVGEQFRSVDSTSTLLVLV